MSLVSNRPNFGFNPGFAASNSPAHACRLKDAGRDANPLEDLLIKTGRSGAMLNPSKKESLEKVAAFMDKHPEVFGKPHGRETWLSELKEDNFLSGKEANKFSGAIDMMKDAIGAGGAQAPGAQSGNVEAQNQGGGAKQDLDNSLIPTGNGESVLNPSKKSELESVAKFMDQHPEVFGKPDGKESWLSELKEDNQLNKAETKGFSNAIDMMKDAQGAFGGGEAQETNGTGNNANVGQSQPQAQGLGQGGLDLKNTLVETGKGDSYLNPTKKNELEAVAKYMDQHPEIFGNPDGKESWLSELKEDNYLDKNETKGFKKAMDLMQDAGVGQAGSTGQANGSPQGAAGAPDSFAGGQGGFNPNAGQSQGQGQGGGLDLKDALVQTGKGDAFLNPSLKIELESVAKFMDQHPDKFGKPEGKGSWLSELKEDNYLDKNENKAFSSAIDMMQDARSAGGVGQGQENAPAQSNGQQNAVSDTPPRAAAPSTEQSPGQGGKPNLDDVLVQTGKGDAFFNPSKKAEMESVAKFMDQNPDKFGKPEGKQTWLSELKEDNYLDSKENKSFSKAIDMMKDAQSA
jgi:hypothetical protein